jgi:hypothetical protein
VTLTLRQAVDGQLTGTMSGNGTEFRVEGMVEEGVAMGAITSAQGGLLFEATLDGDQLTLTLVEVGAGNVPDYSKARTIVLHRAGGAVPPGGGGVPGASPLARAGGPFTGSFSGDGITVAFSGATGSYRGTLTFQGASYPIQGEAQGDRLEGTFTADGQSYPFAAVLEGTGIVLESGGQRYALQRVGGSPPANPLATRGGAPAGGGGSGIIGRWACQTGQGTAQLAFVSDRELVFNGERTSYQMSGATIQVQGEWGPVVYQYTLEGNRLAVSAPDGSAMQCQRQADGVSAGAPGGGMESMLQGPRCSYSSSPDGGYSTLHKLYFDGQGRFTSGTESAYSGDPGSAYGLSNDPNAGVYRVTGNSKGAGIHLTFPDGSTAVAHVYFVDSDTGQILELQLNDRLYAPSLCR